MTGHAGANTSAVSAAASQLPDPPRGFDAVDWSEPYTFQQLQAFAEIDSIYAGQTLGWVGMHCSVQLTHAHTMQPHKSGRMQACAAVHGHA